LHHTRALKPELTSKLRGRNSGLSLLLQKLTSKLFGRHAHLGRLPCKLPLQLSRGHAQLACELLCGNACLGLLLCCLRRKLLARKTQLPSRLRGRKPSLCALRPKRARKLRGLLCPALLRFKRRLRPLCSRLKSCLAHLCRGPPLLLQDIALKLLLGHRLTRSAKRPRANGLRCNTLLCNLTLTGNVCQSLLHRSILILVHKAPRRRGVKRPRCARQPCNALLCSRSAKGPRLLQRLRRLRGNPPRALYCCCLVRSGLLCRGPRTGARGCRLLARQRANAAQFGGEARSNAPRATNSTYRANACLLRCQCRGLRALRRGLLPLKARCRQALLPSERLQPRGIRCGINSGLRAACLPKRIQRCGARYVARRIR
jgi:hypothetical protein